MGLGEPGYDGSPILLNWWKSGGEVEVTKDAVTYLTRYPPGHPLSAWDYLDANGNLLNPLPSGITTYKRIFYGPPAIGTGFDPTTEVMYYSFTGTASTVEVQNAKWITSRVGNYREFQLLSASSNSYIYWQNIGTNDPPRNIVVGIKKYKSLIDAGEMFDPVWLSEIGRSSGVLRTATWSNAYLDQTTLRFADIPSVDFNFWTGSAPKTGIPGGMPLAVCAGIANKTKKHLWVNVQAILGLPKACSITSITRGVLSTCLAYGHNFADGDQVVVCAGPTGWPGLGAQLYTVSNSNPGAHTFDINLNSTGYPAYDPAYNACAIMEPDLAQLTTDLTPQVEYYRDNTSPNRLVFWEYMTENWNPGFFSKAFCTAQAAVRYGDNTKGVQFAGYMSAHIMRVVRDVYGMANRQRWKGLFAAWTVIADTTDQFLAGIDEYIAEQIPGTPITELFDYDALTGYWNGPHGAVYKTTLFGWMDTSESRWLAGLEPTKYAYYDRMVNEERYDGRHIGITNTVLHIQTYWLNHQTKVAKRGLKICQYEGGDHDEMNASNLWNACNASEKTRLIEFYKETTHSELSGINYTTMFQRFADIGGEYPSKFIDLGPITQYGNWGGLRSIGDSNPVWDAVVKANRS